MATAQGRARSARAALISILALSAIAVSAGGVSAAPPAALSVSPDTLSFGSVLNNSTSTQSVAVTTGRKALVLGILTNDGQYKDALTGTCWTEWGNEVPANTSCSIDVSFTPLTAHDWPATLYVDSCMKWHADLATGAPKCDRIRDEVTVSMQGAGQNA